MNTSDKIALVALVLSGVAIALPIFKDWFANKKALFLALREDRKAIAIVTVEVIDGTYDGKLQRNPQFRKQLLQALAIAISQESSDRGKAYILAAMVHIARLSVAARLEAVGQLERVLQTFRAYAATNADRHFAAERIIPLEAIREAVKNTP